MFGNNISVGHCYLSYLLDALFVLTLAKSFKTILNANTQTQTLFAVNYNSALVTTGTKFGYGN